MKQIELDNLPNVFHKKQAMISTRWIQIVIYPRAIAKRFFQNVKKMFVVFQKPNNDTTLVHVRIETITVPIEDNIHTSSSSCSNDCILVSKVKSDDTHCRLMIEELLLKKMEKSK